MCCLFTCCGWMVDLIQRLWTFTMSCCISSAVCCSLITASMSGVALGYNYSLAEYIDLKETNVSVYLKRGVFDDDIADDMEWRRSGHQPIAGHIRENNLLTGSEDTSSTLRSGRRLDDSIYESNDRNNFEGSLMRLTAKAPDPSPSESSTEMSLSELIKQYPSGSLDQLKAVQSAINMRKAAAAARTKSQFQKTPLSNENVPQNIRDMYNRRAMKFDVPPFEDPSTISSLRQAVPDDTINDSSKWMLPKLPLHLVPKNVLYVDDIMSPTYPPPVTPRAGPIRPTRPRPPPRTRPTPTKIVSNVPSRSSEPKIHKSIDDEMDSFKDKLIVDKLDASGSEDEFLQKFKIAAKKSDEDYEEEIKGIPLRKKRSNNLELGNKKRSDENTSKTLIEILSSNKNPNQEDQKSVTLKNLKIPSRDTLIKLLFTSTIS